jgi:hypothetical protein
MCPIPMPWALFHTVLVLQWGVIITAPNSNLEYNPLAAVHGSVFNVFKATIPIYRLSSPPATSACAMLWRQGPHIMEWGITHIYRHRYMAYVGVHVYIYIYSEKQSGQLDFQQLYRSHRSSFISFVHMRMHSYWSTVMKSARILVLNRLNYSLLAC